ncbi:class I SAM-dependent methyltransferase [Fretibacterium sp. OH1220_COT-178]|uniref:class I SAM-dependent methyltransferase n=1 Tax=Fretibacterium sp. OH1220_COT-178 TaxID=2491047 RepID=UPI000F5D7193|nr:class I SAM-dependent methyltransferase [Fretibacterium sp. OH1220_COT-178]RRD65266.1 class I SAM-dependent methyltransferase [Fretibacterium sp. OH1220_COT-178]
MTGNGGKNEGRDFRGRGRAFKGIFGGENYRLLAGLFGIKERFYLKGIGGLRLGPGERALDLGCGPGGLSYALAKDAPADASIFGIDISDDQLACARSGAGGFACPVEFLKASMDELPFPDGHFDLVMTSMALHETPPAVRRGALSETARVLRPGGTFLLVDWSRPRFGLWGIVWYPLCRWGERNRDNWNNVYPRLCLERGLTLREDAYLNSIARRQVFVKESQGRMPRKDG